MVYVFNITPHHFTHIARRSYLTGVIVTRVYVFINVLIIGHHRLKTTLHERVVFVI